VHRAHWTPMTMEKELRKSLPVWVLGYWALIGDRFLDIGYLGSDWRPLLNSRVCLAIAGLGLSLLIGFSSFAGEAIYDRDGNLKYRIDDNGRIYDRDWNRKGRVEGSKVYDEKQNFKYHIDGNKVYDRNWDLKYQRDGDRIYDRNWNLKGRIQKR